MSPEQIVQVVGVLTVAFNREATPDLFDVYSFALADVEVDDPVGVVKRLLRTLDRWPPPAVLRSALLGDQGVLAPEEDEAWSMVLDVATRGRHEAPPLPPIVEQALASIGGPFAVQHSENPTTIRAQFRDAYRGAKARHDREVLAADRPSHRPAL